MSDLSSLETMLAESQTRYSTWSIREYVDRKGEAVTLDPQGWVVNFGALDDGPYTEFVFDAQGKLIQATSGYFETKNHQVVKYVSI